MKSLLVDKLSKMKSYRAKTAVSDIQIEEAENKLCLKFSQEYREYLQEVGCASIYGHEFTGICGSSRLNVVDVTIEERAYSNLIPNDFYVVEQSNIDGIVIWQKSSGEIYGSKPNQEPAYICNSILEYLND